MSYGNIWKKVKRKKKQKNVKKSEKYKQERYSK